MIYVFGGADLVTQLANEGLLNEIMITAVPVMIGPGLPLFAEGVQDLSLRLVRQRVFPDGVVQAIYAV